MKTGASSASPNPLFNGRAKSRIDVGIEIGTSKVCVAVGTRGADRTLRILGVGQAVSRGVRHGVIAAPHLAQQAVREALQNAESESDVLIGSVRLALGGEHLSSFNHRIGINILDDPGEIEESDCQLLWESARQAETQPENTVVQCILQSYSIDEQKGIINPVGLHGHRLEADFHIVEGHRKSMQISVDCLNALGVEIEDTVFAPVATAQALLSQDHKMKGALVIDLGAGTTTYALFLEGIIQQSGVLAVGGDQITHAVSKNWGLPLAVAERLKIEEGSALDGNHLSPEIILIGTDSGLADTEIERETLNRVIQLRLRETLEVLKSKIIGKTPLKSLDAGLFFTGGTSLLTGIGPLAQQIFGLSVHLTHEQTVPGLDEVFKQPQYSAALGLVCDLP